MAISRLSTILKGAGRFDLSLSPMPGAIQGKVDLNRVTFALNGDSYTFVTGASITRSQTLWIRYDRNPPSWDSTAVSYLGSEEISKMFSPAAQN